MRHLFLLLFICGIYISNAQQLVVGKIIDTENLPLVDITVIQSDFLKSASTDEEGYFHILIDDSHEKRLSFESPFYQTQTIYNIDTIQQMLTIVLASKNKKDIGTTYYKRKKRSVQGAFQVDITYFNFDQFAPTIGAYNTEVLNGFLGVFNFDFSSTYQKRTWGFSYGLLFSDFPNDSLDIEIIKSEWALHFGYQLVNSKRISIQPNVGLKWYRYRLLNNHEAEEVPLNTYLAERDLDLRFNQATGFAGANFAYKILPKNKEKYLSTAYWTIGVYAGYLFKLHEKPFIYSTRSRLSTDLEIDLNPINYGIFFTWNID